jgi:hypothetical protein
MTVNQAIAFLLTVKAKAGGELPLYFDCPKCEASFTPDKVETVSVHVAGKKEPTR